MTTARLLALCAALLLTHPVSAQLEPGSEPVSLGPLGGSAISVVVDPQDADVILVVRYLEGLLRSVDAGATFAPFGTGISADLRDVVQDPADDQGLYALDGNQVFHSSDFGATWSALSLVAPETLKGIALPQVGDDILVYDAFNVHHSPDGGTSWAVAAALVPFAGNLFDSAAYAADGTVAYVGSFDGVHRSSDGGASFAAPSPAFDEWVQSLTVSPGDPDTVYAGTPFAGLHRSTDGGATFTPIGAPTTNGNAEWFAWEPGGRLWYATLTTLVHSPDGGGTWFDGTAGWPVNTPIPAALGFAPDGLRYFGCEGGGLYDQSGGGLYRMPAGAPSVWEHIGFLVARINDLAIAGPGGTRVLGIGSGVYAGAPGVPPTPTAWHADIGTDTRAVAIDPSNTDRWVTGGVGAFLDNAQIVVLTNGGDTFAKTYERSGAGTVQDVAFDPFDAGRLVAGIFPGSFGNEAIIRSSNGGNSWIDVAGTAGWATRAVAFDPHTPGRVLQLSDNNQWSQSLDSGVSWTALQPAWPASGPAVLLAFDPFASGVIFRGDAGSGLWRSLDDGANWSALGVTLQADSDIEFDPHQPGLLWVSNAGSQVLVSDDGGSSFAVALDVPLGADGSALALDGSDGTLLVGTTSAATWELPGASPVLDLAGGSLGSGGFVPRLTLGGGLPQLGNAGFALAGDRFRGGAPVYLAIGGSDQPLNVYGGTFHVGPPTFWFAFSAAGPAGVAGAGTFLAGAPLPPDPLLIGLVVYAQCGSLDAGAAHPSGRVLSGALSIRLHD